jgi:hypothetical protein
MREVTKLGEGFRGVASASSRVESISELHQHPTLFHFTGNKWLSL